MVSRRPRGSVAGDQGGASAGVTPEGSPAQDILLRELARFRERRRRARSTRGIRARPRVPSWAWRRRQRAAEVLGPREAAAADGHRAPRSLGPRAAAQTEADRETLRVAAELQELVSSLAPKSSTFRAVQLVGGCPGARRGSRAAPCRRCRWTSRC